MYDGKHILNKNFELQKSDDEKDIEPGVLRSKHSGKLRWKGSSTQGNKSSISENITQKSCNMALQTVQIPGK